MTRYSRFNFEGTYLENVVEYYAEWHDRRNVCKNWKPSQNFQMANEWQQNDWH